MISKSDLKKPQASLSKLRSEEVSKYRLGEEQERLATLGQTSDLKAKKWVQEDFAKQEKLQRAAFDNDLELLSQLRLGDRKHYFKYLVRVFMRYTQDEEVPKKYQMLVDLTNVGLVIKIAKTKYQGAFKVSGIPLYDLHACKMMAVRLGNTIAKLEGYIRSTEAGVLLPDEEDVKKYA